MLKFLYEVFLIAAALATVLGSTVWLLIISDKQTQKFNKNKRDNLTIVLPPVNLPENNHNPSVCNCDLVGMEDKCYIQPPYLSPLNRLQETLQQREQQLLEALKTIEILKSDSSKNK